MKKVLKRGIFCYQNSEPSELVIELAIILEKFEKLEFKCAIKNEKGVTANVLWTGMFSSFAQIFVEFLQNGENVVFKLEHCASLTLTTEDETQGCVALTDFTATFGMPAVIFLKMKANFTEVLKELINPVVH